MKTFFFSLLSLTCSFFSHARAHDGQIANVNGIKIWYETFGQKKNPAFLLIMGGCCQGILWPSEFCQRLADEGFFVIRYDNRDTGLSSCFDFEKHPYSLLDMTKDAIGLLDHLKINRAHVFGLSMGGPIAQLMAVHYPQRILSIALVATSCEFRPMNLAYAGLPAEENSLSRPKDVYLKWMQEFQQNIPQNPEEALEQRLVCWRILSGSVVPFEEDRYRELHRLFLDRQKYPEAMKNHLFVCKNSEELIRSVSSQVRVPTVIFHGSEDAIFPIDHGEKLSQTIPRSKFIPVHGLGHILNCAFYDLLIKELKLNASRR